MKLLGRVGSALLIVLLSLPAQARKFSFENEGLSTYLRGTGGLSNVAKDAFGKASGNNTLIDDKVNFNFSGEVGVAVSIASMVIRVGVEGLVPKKASGGVGKLSDGTELFSLDSEILGVNPVVSAEFALYQDAHSRFMVGGSVGQVSAEIKNTYQFEAAGLTEFGLTENYVEVGKASALGGAIYAGIESLMVDNVTFSIDVGYRLYNLNGFTHSQAATTINGTVAEGDPMVNSDGSERTLNLSGLYLGLGLRFYIML